MNELEYKAIMAQAIIEYKAEVYRQAVEKYKEKLRTKRSFWDRVFPWKIVIIRKEKPCSI